MFNLSEYDFDDQLDVADVGSNVSGAVSSTARGLRTAARGTKKAVKAGKKAVKAGGKAAKSAGKVIGQIVIKIISALSAITLPVLAIVIVCVLVIFMIFGAASSNNNNSSSNANNFTPRLTEPESTNHFYYSNDNIFYASGYGMPNCTAYAYGRAYELLGTKPDLCSGNAEDWYDYNKSHHYYAYGHTARLGAIAVWSHPGGGHVAVVEKIEDGQITFSNSAYGRSDLNFYLTTVSESDENANYNDSWTLLGYIYVYTESDAVVNTLPSTVDVDGVAAKIYMYFTTHGLNVAATCGILGNIQQECGFNDYYYFAEYVADAAGASGNSGGIAMWYGDNNARFRRDCPNWKTSVDAQIEYLYQTLIKDGQGSPSDKYYYYCTGCWSKLKSVPNTREGAAEAARIFRDYYERPAAGYEGPREEYAQSFWDKFH